MRSVPRHAFLPRAAIEVAYADRSVTTKAGGDRPLSCASHPAVVALMLEQLDVQPGHHVLEIGAGAGYNAALLHHLTGATGHVTTVDIDPDATAGARSALDVTGHPQVQVVAGDGALGHLANAPYDRIVVTVGPWDIPSAWVDQLAPDGRLVVPLHWRGQARCVGLACHGGVLRSDSVEVCGFIPMVGQHAERGAALDAAGGATFHWDTDQAIDAARLHGVLDQPHDVTWSGITVAPDEPFDGIWLRLAATDPGTCRLVTTAATAERLSARPIVPSQTPAIVADESLAYLALRRVGDEPSRWELGVAAYGPHRAALTDRFERRLTAWGHDRQARPTVTAWPTGTPAPEGDTGTDLVRPCITFRVDYGPRER